MGTSAHHANAHIYIRFARNAKFICSGTRGNNEKEDDLESGYLDNDKMLLQCYMRVESGSPW